MTRLRTISLAVAALSVPVIGAGAIPASAGDADLVAASAKKGAKVVGGDYGGSTTQGRSLALTVSKGKARFPPLDIGLGCITSTGETGAETQTMGPFALKIEKKGRVDGRRSFNGGTLTIDGRFKGKSFGGSLLFTGTTLGGSGLPAGSLCVTPTPIGLFALKLPK